MHPRQARLLAVTSEIVDKIAAAKPKPMTGTPLLWKFVDPDSNQEFFLPERLRTVHSPYSGKSFSAKPEKLTIPAVSKEMKDERKAPASAAGAPGPKVTTKKKRADWEV